MVAITEDDIRSLAAFKGDGAPVTSVYLDVDGGRHVRFQDAVRSAESLLKDALAKHADEPSVAADLQRVQELVRAGIDRSRTRGLAVFSCSAHDFWRVIELPVAGSAIVAMPLLTTSGFSFPASNCRSTNCRMPPCW